MTVPVELPAPEAGQPLLADGAAVARSLRNVLARFPRLADHPGVHATLDRVERHALVPARAAARGTLLRDAMYRPVKPVAGRCSSAAWVLVELPEVEGLRALLIELGLSERVCVGVRRVHVTLAEPAPSSRR